MGCDGGTIPKRHELCKTKKRAEQRDRNADLIAKWKYCALSNEPLREPIVACELGKLYSKDAIIEYLLDKAGEKVEKMKHIRGLKDVHTLKLQSNPAWKSKTEQAEKGDGYIDDQNSKYICPIAGVEMNGRYKFCYIRGCGCVFSTRALKEVKDESCPTCSEKYSKENDVILLNASEEEEKNLRKKMEERKELEKSERKKRKETKKNGTDGKLSNIPNGKSHPNKTTGKPSTSGAEKSSNEHNLSKSKLKNLEVNGTITGAKRKIKEDKIFKSEAFKSIFTSHSSAKRSKDAQGHWITYNPYHYAG